MKEIHRYMLRTGETWAMQMGRRFEDCFADKLCHNLNIASKISYSWSVPVFEAKQ